MNTKLLAVALSSLAISMGGCANQSAPAPAAGGMAIDLAAPPPLPPGIQTVELVATTNSFLAMLSPADRAKTVYPFEGEQRTKWSNLPTGIFARTGARFGDMSPSQREAAHAILRTALSPEGYRKVVEIMAADEYLKGQSAANARTIFGADEYYIAILGTPSAMDPWTIQFGGHHLAINVTMVGRSSVLTPSLPATQPATFTLDGRTIRPLGDEYDKAFALMATLDESQRREAVLGFQVRDLALGAGQDGKTIQPEGIRVSRFNAAQQALLLDLAGEWVNILNADGAATKMAEIRANLADTWFAWSGPTTKGNAAYFRIQGPTVVIEYAPQGRETGTDQGVDHVHTMYRDPTNDYGARLTSR